jgi:hypothetical protein
MYVLPERNLVYLAHPRTASVATKRTLAQLGPMEMYQGHHGVDPDRIPVGATVMTTIRNPWDAFVSWWFKRRGAMSPFYDLPLEEFIPQLVENNQQYFRGGKMFYMVPYANVILSYHHLQEQFDLAIVKVGYAPHDLLVANKSSKREPGWKQYYNKAAHDWVADYFADEIKRFGFKFV